MNGTIIKSHHHSSPSESGFALLLTVFIISLVTILVMGLSEDIRAFQRSARNYTDQGQATMMLKAGVNLGRLLLEAPKADLTKGEDWLNEPWSNIGATPSIPIEGFIGELRIMIVDEDGKIDINSIQQPGVASGTPPGQGQATPFADPQQAAQAGQTPQPDTQLFWKSTVSELFARAGFVEENYGDETFRSYGNAGFGPDDQVAIISDWIDRDDDPYENQQFKGKGFESVADRKRAGWFFNRSLRSISELLLVPGMTLERVQRVAPFLKVSQGFAGVSSAINVNTAPIEVLQAMGLPDGQVQEIAERRLNLPYTQEMLASLTAGDPSLANRFKVSSGEFSVYARVEMPSRTFWAKAIVSVQNTGGPLRRANVRSIEYY